MIISPPCIIQANTLNKFKKLRPISNLKALSKIIEKSVALQLNNYLTNNNLHETFQSAYKVHHSTETVMVKVQDDILHGIDSNRAVVLFMLHLSAAFDTVSHEILLNRLTQRYGIVGGGVRPGSPNPNPISDQKMLLSRPVFRPEVL